MVHPKQKLIVNTQKKKREEYEHTSQESHQITKEDSKRGIKKQGNNKRARNQQEDNSKSVTTLNVST